MAKPATKSKIVDVSKWQGKIAWGTAKSEVALAIIRVQDGMHHYDEQLENNIEGCQKNNIPFGVYAFFRASNAAEAVAEMKAFVDRTKAAGGGALFYVIDCETDDCNKASIRAAVNYLHSLKLRVGIYFAHHMYPRYGGDYGQNFTWIPRYGSKPKYRCDLWQYTSSGSVKGIKGDVDLNIINGSKTLAWFVSPHKANTKAHATTMHTTYIVKAGDTLTEIAEKFHTTVAALVKLNNIANKNLIYRGQKIRIPK